MIEKIEKIKSRAIERLKQNDDAHGYQHAERVEKLADAIRKNEGGDELILKASSYLHDWCSYGGREFHVSEPALSEIKDELLDIKFLFRKIKPTIDVIRHHEDYNFHGKQRLSKECLIFQDADRIDALGAIGIARCFYTTATLGYPLGTPDEMNELEKHYNVGQFTSAIQHFYTKLLNLKDSMNTKYAKHIAQKRHDFMVEFLGRFKQEWRADL